MINFSCGSTTIAILLLATTAYGQCEYNIQYTYSIHSTSMSEVLHIRCMKFVQSHSLRWDLAYSDYSILHTHVLDVLTQVHQHLLNSVERPIKEVVDKMESTLLTLDVENHLTSSAI